MDRLSATVLVLIFGGGISSCARDRIDLTRQTGISPCSTASVRRLPSGLGDVSYYEVTADGRRCTPSLSQSVITASKLSAEGSCRDVLRTFGACAYTYDQRTVSVESMAQNGKIDGYQIKSW